MPDTKNPNGNSSQTTDKITEAEKERYMGHTDGCTLQVVPAPQIVSAQINMDPAEINLVLAEIKERRAISNINTLKGKDTPLRVKSATSLQRNGKIKVIDLKGEREPSSQIPSTNEIATNRRTIADRVMDENPDIYTTELNGGTNTDQVGR